METCDYLVIGGGSAGIRSSKIAASLGAKVIIAESGKLGGTCVNCGCVPKKLFTYAAKFKSEILLARQYGWDITENNFNWTEFINKKNEEILRLNDVYYSTIEKQGVQLVRGTAEFVSHDIVELAGTKYKPKHILIATGSRPRSLDIPGADLAITSDHIFHIKNLPSKILIIGGGYIGFEFASIFSNFGSSVDLAYYQNIFLRHFDAEVKEKLKQSLIQNGVNFFSDESIKKLTTVDNKIQVEFSNGKTTYYDVVLSAIGRVPNLEALQLQNTKIELTKQGLIKIDNNFETTQKSVFAIGDVSSPLALTPVAIREGTILANNLFGQPTKNFDYATVPTTIFTEPQLAMVGLTEEQALASGKELKIYKSSFSPMRSAFGGDKTQFFIKLITEKSSEKVLGLHILGSDAAEIMQGFALILSMGGTKADLDKVMAIHPTSAEEIVTLK